MTEPTPRALRNPWWIPPFLGRVPAGVEERHLAVLGIVALALLFESYDMALLTAALGRIASDFGLSEATQGLFTGSIRLGALPAFFVIPLADRLGRRRLFLVSVAGFSIGAFLTAFAQTPEQFVVCQMLSRTFVISASASAFATLWAFDESTMPAISLSTCHKPRRSSARVTISSDTLIRPSCCSAFAV